MSVPTGRLRRRQPTDPATAHTATRRDHRHDHSPSKPTTCRRPSRASGRSAPSTGSASPSRRAPCSASSVPTARARPPRSGCSPPSSGPTAARPGCWATTCRRRPALVRTLIGLAGQYAAVDENLTGRENIQMVGNLNHLRTQLSWPSAPSICSDQFNLTEAGDRPLKTYSGGMRRRLDLAAALVARPTVLFLDEPTTGLDPQSRNDLWEVIEQLVGRGHDRPPHHPVPRGGRPPGQPSGRARPRPGHRRGDAGVDEGRPRRHRPRGRPALPRRRPPHRRHPRRPRAPLRAGQRHPGRGHRGQRAAGRHAGPADAGRRRHPPRPRSTSASRASTTSSFPSPATAPRSDEEPDRRRHADAGSAAPAHAPGASRPCPWPPGSSHDHRRRRRTDRARGAARLGRHLQDPLGRLGHPDADPAQPAGHHPDPRGALLLDDPADHVRAAVPLRVRRRHQQCPAACPTSTT